MRMDEQYVLILAGAVVISYGLAGALRRKRLWGQAPAPRARRGFMAHHGREV